MSRMHERDHSPGRLRTALAMRALGGVIAVGSMLAIVGGVGSVAYAEAAAPMKNCGGCLYSWVCLYVNEPGQPERLVPGDDNPTGVSNELLVGDDFEPVEVGQQFWQGQIRSVVIVANLENNPFKQVPTVEDCPPPTPPLSSTATTTSPTTSPTSSSTTSSSTTTHPSLSATASSSSSTAPVPAVTTYPLQPVNAGAASETAAAFTPGRVGLLVAALLGLWALLRGGQLPKLPRLRRPNRVSSPRE